jgi:hypothetical protein
MRNKILILFLTLSVWGTAFSQNEGGDYNPNTFCDKIVCEIVSDLNQNYLDKQYQEGMWNIIGVVGDCVLNEMGWDDWDHWSDYIENLILSPWEIAELADDCSALAWDMADNLDNQYVDGLQCNEARNDTCYNANGCEVNPLYDNSGEEAIYCN